MRKVIFLLIGILFTGFNSATAQDNDTKLIQQLTNTWEKETNAGNVDGLLGTVTDDAKILMPGTSPIEGKESIEAVYRDYYSAYDLEFSATINEVEVFGKKAYVWTLVEGTRKSKKDGEVEQLAFNNIWLLKKQSSGWKFWRVIFNSTPHTE